MPHETDTMAHALHCNDLGLLNIRSIEYLDGGDHESGMDDLRDYGMHGWENRKDN